jgi:hypothetical protein
MEFPPLPRRVTIPPLPRRVTLRQIYSDFIKYLYDYTQEFFVETMPNGQRIWDRVKSKMIIIFCHPNKCNTLQQSFLRDCTVGAGIMKESEADSRIDFITEEEGMIHWALADTMSTTWLQTGTPFVVVNAGDYRTDSTLYECKSNKPLILEEVQRSERVQVSV